MYPLDGGGGWLAGTLEQEAGSVGTLMVEEGLDCKTVGWVGTMNTENFEHFELNFALLWAVIESSRKTWTRE